MTYSERRRRIQLTTRALDNAKGLLRSASDQLTIAIDQLDLARDEDRPPGEHQRNP